MAKEIERKFLVTEGYRQFVSDSVRIVQGYLNSTPERTVRVRIKGDRGYLTVKGLSSENGMSRYEWEKEISVADAHELMKICEPGVIDKTRYMVEVGRHVYEVDEFHGCNEGLILAEIELENESEVFDRPDWLAEEVTGDVRYYNSALKRNPYKNWKKI